MGVSYFDGSPLWMSMKFKSDNGFFFLIAEIPLLNDLLSRFEFNVFPHDTSTPQRKLGSGFSGHFGFLARPKLNGGRIGQRQVNFFGRCMQGIIFLEVLHSVKGNYSTRALLRIPVKQGSSPKRRISCAVNDLGFLCDLRRNITCLLYLCELTS